ncbi:excalibur calcium-binding domain-containing protein [Tateyamaria sp.]|uniref:excalibur calcium-binding domain-containing protein n=2 Tax=Tateyamaria sp. TaxID=1929288 RepID=UPI0039B83BF2
MKRALAFVFMGLLLQAACSTNDSASISRAVSNASSIQLWAEQRNPQTGALQLAYVETELASRGQATFGSSYIGQRTSSRFGVASYSRQADASVKEKGHDLRNCSDFGASWQAQRFFLSQGGPSSDPHNLDRDGDGLACEWGTRISSIAKKARQPARVSRPRYTPRCYTGPRGGRYTVSASGSKNYGGC